MSAIEDHKPAENPFVSQFNKHWFIKIFAQYPFLLKFVSKGIQASSDGTDPTKAKNLTPWHQAIYEALDELRPRSYIHGERYHELERTLLSFIVFSVMRQKNYDPALFFKAHKSNLDVKDIDTINQLYISDEASMNLSMGMGDVGKIDEVKRHFDSPTDDQDRAVDYILQLDSKLLGSFFKITPEQVAHLKKYPSFLHLGHAVQGECTPKKFIEAQRFLHSPPEAESEAIIKYAIFKQLLDVMGARAQNGTVLLNKAILENYFTLMDYLFKLAKAGSDPVQLYWQFVTRSIRDRKIVFRDLELNQTETAGGVSCYSKKGLVWRLCLQLRITQLDSKEAQREALMLEAAVSKVLSTPALRHLVEEIEKYDESMPHTMTYGPAIFSTLKEQGQKLYASSSPKLGMATNYIEYAVFTGLAIQAAACRAYSARVRQYPALKASPLQFNSLNAEMQKDVLLAQHIALGERGVVVDGRGAAVSPAPWRKYTPYLMSALLTTVGVAMWACRLSAQSDLSASLGFSPRPH